MLLNIKMAEEAVHKAYPGCTIRVGIEHKERYLFVVYFMDDPNSFFDPFYSANKETGEVRDFSMINDPDADLIYALLEAEITKKEGLADE